MRKTIVYIFITKKKVFIQEWIGSIDKDIGSGVLRIRYTRNSEDTDKFYFKKGLIK